MTVSYTHLVVLMLGTNDCKTMYDTSAEVIGRGVERLLDQIRSSTPDSKILLMSPIALGEGVGEAGYDPEFDESSVAVDVYKRQICVWMRTAEDSISGSSCTGMCWIMRRRPAVTM